MGSFLHIWQADLAGPPSAWQLAEASLRPAELGRRARLLTPELRQTYGRAHAFKRAVLSFYTELPPSCLAFATAGQGKPLLLGSDLHFDLSYRGERALLAVSNIGPVGADVEQLHRLPNADALVARLLSGPERLGLRSAPEAAYWPFFYTIRTRKEAYAKALGMGLAVSFAGFSVLEPGADGYPQLIAPAGSRVLSFAVGAGYQGAVAVLTSHDLPTACYFRYPLES